MITQFIASIVVVVFTIFVLGAYGMWDSHRRSVSARKREESLSRAESALKTTHNSLSTPRSMPKAARVVPISEARKTPGA